MSKKTNSAIIKRDSLENWSKAKNYIPKENVIIIVDNPDGSFQLKVGNGKILVNDLPNILKIDVDPKAPSVEKEVLTFD